MIPTSIKEKDFRYRQQDDAEILNELNKFHILIDGFSEKLPYSNAEIEINYDILYRIFERIDQRRDYYKYFHSTENEIMYMSQTKEIALMAYWIMKYKLLRFSTNQMEEEFFRDNGCTVNELFSIYAIIGVICDISKEQKKYFTAKKVRVLMYDFINRDFSKESIISYVESFLP